MIGIEEKLTARDIALRSWRSLGAAFRVMPLLFIVTLSLGAAWCVAVVAIAALKAAMTVPKFEDFSAQTLAVYSGAHVLDLLFWAALATPLAVAVHRFILLRQPRPRLLEVRHFFLWLAGLGLAFLAARAFCLLLSAVSFVRGLTEFTVTIGAVIVALQIGLIFPAIATGVPAASMEQRIDSGFRMSEGRFLLLLRTIALTLIPLIILMVVLSRISGGPPPAKLAAGAPPALTLPITPVRLVAAGALGAVQAAALVLVAATLSFLYAHQRKDT